MTRAERRHRRGRARAHREQVWSHVWHAADWPLNHKHKTTLRPCSCVACKRYQGEPAPDHGPQINEEW